MKLRPDFAVHFMVSNIRKEILIVAFRGGSRGRVQEVRTPPPLRDDLRFSNTTGILQRKNYMVYWC